MSSENLNINVNPLEEKSDKIEFTVDKMGLSNPAQTIPTDVDYFVRKQKGELESKFTWSEALAKSFEIDNLVGSFINNFGKEDGYDIDFDFVPSKELVDRIDKYPEYIRDAFYDAKSESHFYDIEKQVQERLKTEAEISKLGWSGFGARMVAAVADPAAIALSILTIPFGGYGAYATIPSKVMRIKRALKFGAIVAGENAVIEAGLVGMDKYKNPIDIQYAALAGFALGSPAGWFGRVNAKKNAVPKEIVTSHKKLDNAAEKYKQALELQEIQEFATKNNLELNPNFVKNKRMILSKEANSMNPKVVDDPRNAPGDGSYWEEKFKKTHLRFDISSQLNRSPDPIVRRFRETFVNDPVVGNTKGDTAIDWKNRTQYQTMYDYMNYREVALRSFKNANRDVSFKSQFDIEEKFEALMSDLKEFPERFVGSKEITPEMKNLSKLAAKAFDNTLDIVAQTGREGWNEIAGRRVPNYIPHVHSPSKVMRAIDDYGQDQVEQVFAHALRDMKGDLGNKVFSRMIKRIVGKISNSRYYGQETDLARAFQGSNIAVIREFLEGLDLTKEQVQAILNKIQKGSGNTLDPNARTRLPFQLNERIDIKNNKTGTIDSLSVKDLTDRNLTRLLKRYNQQVLGAAAMARFGNFKNNKEYVDFLKEVKERGEANPKYKNIYRDIENIEVIVSSLMGKQSPLERNGDPNGFMRRMARLAQDYNFLRLFGQVGFAQGAELYQAVSEVGLKTFLEANPGFKDILNKLRAGEVKFDDEILEELRSQGVPVGLDKFMHSPVGRLDNELDIPLDSTGSRLDATELYAAKAKRFVADISFLNPLTMYSQIIAGRGLALKISNNVNELIKTHKTTKIFSKLSKGDQIRYKYFGWNEKEFNEIADQINKHSVYKDGKYQGIGLDNWTPTARSHYSVGMQRFIDRVVQRNDVGTMNRWFTSDYARIITQFRTFTLGSYTKQLMSRLYVLAETRGKDFHTYSAFMASMIGAVQFYAVQQYINSFGRSDQKKFLEKRLSPENLAKIGFLRSSWSSLIPGAIDTALYPFMDDLPFSYGRNTEIASQFFSGIPTVNLISSTFNTTKALTKLALDPTYTASKRDVQQGLSLIALQNALIIKNINNIIVDELGE
tara:strand:+ start:2283 stop:5654 length:3372 start_codon:yes stop_codon:yes gene_type:complete